MKSVEELEQELYESETHTVGLEQSLATSKVSDLTGLVSKTGKMRGHLTGLTPRQYEDVIGRKPPPGLLVKARDATTRKVQWDMVLDQLTSERGYKSDEQLRDAIEKAHRDKLELERVKREQRTIRNEIIAKLEAEPEGNKAKAKANKATTTPDTIANYDEGTTINLTNSNNGNEPCPRCGGVLREDIGRDLSCFTCGYVEYERDIIEELTDSIFVGCVSLMRRVFNPEWRYYAEERHYRTGAEWLTPATKARMADGTFGRHTGR